MARNKKAKAPQPIRAAGTVLYRYCDDSGPASGGGSARIRVAVIHRPRRRDLSLPKGKLEAGELPAVAAFRETLEETGITARLGRFLGTVHYDVPVGGKRHSKRVVPKEVHYWAAERTAGEFRKNREVDRLEWLDLDEAAAALTYETDREVLRRFASVTVPLDTLLLVRHARAGAKARWDRPDPLRPLDSVGIRQSRALIPLLQVFDGRTVYSADRVRCVDTVRPYADTIGATVAIEPSLSEESYAADPERAFTRLTGIAASDTVPVVCSQGKVIPFVLADWAERDGVPLAGTRSRKGSLWVLSIHRNVESDHPRLVAADYYDSPLPT